MLPDSAGHELVQLQSDNHKIQLFDHEDDHKTGLLDLSKDFVFSKLEHLCIYSTFEKSSLPTELGTEYNSLVAPEMRFQFNQPQRTEG